MSTMIVLNVMNLIGIFVVAIVAFMNNYKINSSLKLYKNMLNKNIDKLKEFEVKINDNFSSQKENCGFAKTDLPKYLAECKLLINDAISQMQDIIDENKEYYNEKTQASIKEISQLFGEAKIALEDLYSAQPKAEDNLHKHQEEFMKRVYALFVELKDNILSKQEVSLSEYIVFVNIIFDLSLMKFSQMNEDMLKNKSFQMYKSKNALYFSKVADFINTINDSVAKVRYNTDIQGLLLNEVSHMKMNVTTVLFEKMNEFAASKMYKGVMDHNMEILKDQTYTLLTDMIEGHKTKMISILKRGDFNV